MVYQESETVELKSVVVDDIKKEIIAFANCEGGKLYIGVLDDGTVVGLDDPEGVFVRQGYSSVPATNTAIRRMIKETDGDYFEEMRSLEQDLTFEAAKKEFSGSLFRQMNEVYDYIDFRNQTHSSFQKLRRIDQRDYPETAVREALLNLLVHREYSFRASTFISLYADRIEFTSIGGLVSGVTLKDVMMGISVCRNVKLANVFYRLELIEAYGTGILKIMNSYAGTGKKPKIETSDNAFKIILPNLNIQKPDASPSKNSMEEDAEIHIIALQSK